MKPVHKSSILCLERFTIVGESKEEGITTCPALETGKEQDIQFANKSFLVNLEGHWSLANSETSGSSSPLSLMLYSLPLIDLILSAKPSNSSRRLLVESKCLWISLIPLNGGEEKKRMSFFLERI